MSTEILLMADVDGLGVEGDVVNVADGYARNFLFPKKLGAPVTEATKRKLAKLQKDREEKAKAELVEANAILAKLNGVSCTIAMKVAKDGKLYGSVTVANILDSLSAQGVKLPASAIKLEEPLRELGVYDVNVVLNPQVETKIKIWVVEE